MQRKINEMLLAGHSRFNTDLIAIYIGNDEKLFKDLMDITLNGDPPIPQRAAWVITAITDKYPWIINPYISKIIDNLPKFLHPALARNLLRLLSKVDIPFKKTGKLYDYCFQFLIDKKSPVAIRVHAMQILFNIATKEPGLKNELKLVIESILDEAPGGIIAKAKKLLKNL